MTRSEALAARLKNNRIVAVLVVVAAAIAGIAQFTDASQRIFSTFDRDDGGLSELTAALDIDLALFSNGASGFISVIGSEDISDQDAQPLMLKRWADSAGAVEKICVASANPKLLSQEYIGPMLAKLCEEFKFVGRFISDGPNSSEAARAHRVISLGMVAKLQECSRHLRQELKGAPAAEVPEICGRNLVAGIQ